MICDFNFLRGKLASLLDFIETVDIEMLACIDYFGCWSLTLWLWLGRLSRWTLLSKTWADLARQFHGRLTWWCVSLHRARWHRELNVNCFLEPKLIWCYRAFEDLARRNGRLIKLEQYLVLTSHIFRLLFHCWLLSCPRHCKFLLWCLLLKIDCRVGVHDMHISRRLRLPT